MADLSSKQRDQLDKSQFAIPEKAPGSGSYPIPDLAHARNALARVSQFGSADEKARVHAAVAKKYPDLAAGIKGAAAKAAKPEKETPAEGKGETEATETYRKPRSEMEAAAGFLAKRKKQ